MCKKETRGAGRRIKKKRSIFSQNVSACRMPSGSRGQERFVYCANIFLAVLRGIRNVGRGLGVWNLCSVGSRSERFDAYLEMVPAERVDCLQTAPWLADDLLSIDL